MSSARLRPSCSNQLFPSHILRGSKNPVPDHTIEMQREGKDRIAHLTRQSPLEGQEREMILRVGQSDIPSQLYAGGWKAQDTSAMLAYWGPIHNPDPLGLPHPPNGAVTPGIGRSGCRAAARASKPGMKGCRRPSITCTTAPPPASRFHSTTRASSTSSCWEWH